MMVHTISGDCSIGWTIRPGITGKVLPGRGSKEANGHNIVRGVVVMVMTKSDQRMVETITIW
jgi:hypothetical protein